MRGTDGRASESERERERGKVGDFFSSCKPFQLCSGLRTETGREKQVRPQAREGEKVQDKEPGEDSKD